MLVVIAIIGILVALLLPAVQKVREASERTDCANRLRQLGLSLIMYHEANNCFPPGNSAWSPYNQGSWLVYLLPFTDERDLYDAIPNIALPNADPITNMPPGILGSLPRYLRCPADPYQPTRPISNWVGNMGPVPSDPFDYSPWSNPPQPPGPCEPFDAYINPAAYLGGSWGYPVAANEAETSDPAALLGMFARCVSLPSTGIAMKEVPDGLSNTILIGESLPATHGHILVNWYSAGAGFCQLASTKIPINWFIQHDPDPANPGSYPGCVSYRDNHSVAFGFRSNHGPGANFCFVDGSVHFIPPTIDMRLFQLLGVRNDGQAMSYTD
jgi:prepilin-type processing-associated H-X9-DG protein